MGFVAYVTLFDYDGPYTVQIVLIYKNASCHKSYFFIKLPKLFLAEGVSFFSCHDSEC